MAFISNESQQLSFHDSLKVLTAREEKFLSRSWASWFAEHVFPEIDEQIFAPLYSRHGSRPNTPVNVLVGALVLKNLFHLTDEGVMESLLFDLRFQYALHTTSFEEQPLSDRSFGRFRERCRVYREETGVDLLAVQMERLAPRLAEMKEKYPTFA